MAIVTATKPFDHQCGGDYPGDRGIVMEADRPYASGLVFSTRFPGLWVTDSGDVELDEGGVRCPAEDMLAWLEAAAAAIRAHTGIQPNGQVA